MSLWGFCIVKCVFGDRVVIDREQQALNCLLFPELCHLSISLCKEIRDLTWLIHIPSLQFLSIRECGPLAEIIGAFASESAEIEESQNYISNLKLVDLDSLPELRSICSRTMAFPSLQTISVTNCLHLKKHPFNSESAKRSLISIQRSAEWWEQLQWGHDEAAKDVFAAKFVNSEIVISNKGMQTPYSISICFPLQLDFQFYCLLHSVYMHQRQKSYNPLLTENIN